MSLLKDSYKWRDNGPKPVPNKLYEGRFKDPRFIIGIEVEVENAHGVPATYDSSIWQAKNDGSLRNHGLEFVSVPVSTNLIDRAVDSMWNGQPKGWSFGQRTSVHIHHNIRDFSWEELKVLLLTYIVCENVLFDFASPTRRGGIFCVPLIDTQFSEHMIQSIAIDGKGSVSWWDKYSALNLQRIVDLGTIEYRHMEGTKDKEKINLWLDAIYSLYTFARATSLDTFVELIHNTQAVPFLQTVFKGSRLLNRFNEKPVRALCNSGLKAVRMGFKAGESRNLVFTSTTSQNDFVDYLKGFK